LAFQKFSENGAALTPPTLLNDSTLLSTGGTNGGFDMVELNSSGDFAFVYANTSPDIVVNLYNKNSSTPFKTLSLVGNEVAAARDAKPRITKLNSAGDFVVAWEGTDSAANGNDTSIYLQKFNSAGTALTTIQKIESPDFATGGDGNIEITALGSDGSFAVAWVGENGRTDTSSSTSKLLSLYTQRFDASGSKSGSVITLKDTTVTGTGPNGGIDISTEGLPTGDYIVSWTAGVSTQSANTSRVFSDGTFISSSNTVIQNTFPDPLGGTTEISSGVFGGFQNNDQTGVLVINSQGDYVYVTNNNAGLRTDGTFNVVVVNADGTLKNNYRYVISETAPQIGGGNSVYSSMRLHLAKLPGDNNFVVSYSTVVDDRTNAPTIGVRGQVMFNEGNISLGGTQTGTTSSDVLTGTELNDNINITGSSTLAGGADRVLAGAGNDTVTIDGNTRTALVDTSATTANMLIDGGSGINQLIFSQSGSNLDLTNNTVRSKLRNFSTFDITGTGNTTLKVDYDAVVNMSGATDNPATTADESKLLVVNGNAGDTVQVVNLSSWSTSAATQTAAALTATYGSAYQFKAGSTYKEFTRRGATLFVENTVTVSTITSTELFTGQAVSVQTLFGSSFTDVNSGQTFKGVAITNAGVSADLTGKGKYQISTDGTTWTDLAAGLNDTNAVYAAPAALIRFVGVSGVDALRPQDLSVRLIDSSGLTGTGGTLTTGQTINASVNGGFTAFSGNTVTLAAANTAPVSTDGDGVIGGNPLGAAVTAGTPAKTVAQLFGGVYSDANADAMAGVVVTSAGTAANLTALGKYQFSSNNGSTWTDLAGGLTDSTSVYLAKTDLVRFVPSSTNTSSTAKQALTVRLVDDSLVSGNFTSGATVNASVNGGTTAFSGNTVSLGAVVAPVVLDLNRDGELSYANTVMDVNSDGVMDSTLWAGVQEGVLVWDKYHDGRVHDHTQYAFTEYGGSTDLEGLAAGFDSNRDGVFNAADDKFDEFTVWQDANGNGVSDAGEVRSLADWGIASINLVSDGVQRSPVDGVTEAGRSAANLADGSTMLVGDAAFAFRDATADELAAHAVKSTASSDEWQNKPYELSAEEMAQLGLAESSTYSLTNGQSLDLTQVLKDMSVSGIVKGLEQVDMATDTSANVVSLSLADVLSMPPTDGVYKLVLSGAANDKVMLTEGEWTDTGAVVDQGGQSYALYTGTNDSSAQLLIDQQMLQS